ncbi:hypothetical protein BN59_02270 [Legionella massiliensis]|uniref:Uncharacterized protein n=1 Tax=Legionella massiliensis TaxID=1034943 RepID=A0A078L1T3_9GAMM|nr:hypothetical protein [Legionella massiliensis]CDZ77974.1 hypothetical protein BN59_02270 [Legionella massiliensis]CEE13712.1 hypothetical protein BN1094_02270 [Legionella massiliensis]
MKRRQDDSVVDSNKRARMEPVVQIATLGQFLALFSNTNYETLSEYLAQASVEPEVIEEFISNYFWSAYSVELLKKLADGLNQSECYIAVLHLYFEKACVAGCDGLVAYMLEHCKNLDPGHLELRPYKELFLAYAAAKERKQEFNSLALCFDLLLQDPRIEPDKYTLYLACLFRRKEAVILLLDHPNIDPNCLSIIMNESDGDEYEPVVFTANDLSQSLVGWIVAGDVDGGISNYLLKMAGRVEPDLIRDILCCKIVVAVQECDSDSLIHALKSFVSLDSKFIQENCFLYFLFLEIDGREMDATSLMSYMVSDDSFNWAAALEKIWEDDLFDLFTRSDEKLACEMITVLLAAPGFYRFMLNVARYCCIAQADLTSFKLVCGDIEKLSIEEVQRNLVLPLLEEFSNNPKISQELRELWAAAVILPKTKLLLEDAATNYPAFFQARREASGEVSSHCEQISFDL